MQLESLLGVIVPQQLPVRVEQDAVMATAAGHPDGNGGRLQATSWLPCGGVGRLRLALPYHQTDVGALQYPELRKSLWKSDG